MDEAETDTVVMATRVPAFMASALNALAASARPVAPTFRVPTRADLVREALGEYIARRQALAPSPPPPAPRQRSRSMAVPPQPITRRAVAG